MKIVILLIAMTVTNPCKADALWANVEPDMTWSEVAALYPSGASIKHKHGRQIEIKNVSITDECRADVRIAFKAEKVDSLTLQGNPGLKSLCADTVLAGLSAKYGEALSREEIEGSLFIRGGRSYVWNRGDTLMRYMRYTDGPLGGAALGMSSWELRYSAKAKDMGL